MYFLFRHKVLPSSHQYMTQTPINKMETKLLKEGKIIKEMNKMHPQPSTTIIIK